MSAVRSSAQTALDFVKGSSRPSRATDQSDRVVHARGPTAELLAVTLREESLERRRAPGVADDPRPSHVQLEGERGHQR
jgi:hypothetical protein